MQMSPEDVHIADMIEQRIKPLRDNISDLKKQLNPEYESKSEPINSSKMVTLNELPIGSLFKFGNMIGFKSNYWTVWGCY